MLQFFWREKLFDVLFFEQKKASTFYFWTEEGLRILFFNDISLVDWTFQFWLHYTGFISMHQAGYN